ncbi:uncharacterized protein LOC134414061 isoform X2 [Melospiza melodia melodia]|uniref:uncharacterized protein LOC134414061 isoform X2 n=1 Tax=Melospiza melodia melodia TaxID=1914991 RepID=UPI002FD5FFE2
MCLSPELQLTYSQPFSPCSCFELCFIRLHKPQGQEPDRPPPPLDTRHSPAGLPLPIPRRSREEKQLRSRLWKLDGAAWSPAHLSHSAWMELLTTQNQNQALRPRAGTSTLGRHLELLAKDVGGPVVPGESPPEELLQLWDLQHQKSVEQLE